MPVIRLIKKLFKLLFVLLLFSVIYGFVCKWIMPPVTLTQIAHVADGYGLKKDYVRLGEISDNAKLAVIAAEDQLFGLHKGFDWASLGKSLQGENLKAGRARGSAASTISQQTAKNVFLWQGSGIWKYLRKPLEFFYTWFIEKVWGKERILEVYLNVIETGKGVFGFEAAAQKYFNKPAAKLTRREAAMIAASLQNPKVYTIVPMSKHVQWKTGWILKQMNNIQNDRDIKQLLK